jgi:hypothetical protein
LLANGSETTFISRHGLVNMFPRQRIRMQQYRYCWKRCFLLCTCKGVGYKEENWGNQLTSVQETVKKRDRRRGNRKGAAVQRELEHVSRETAIIRNRYKATTSEDTVGCKRQRDFIKCGNTDMLQLFLVTT